MTKSKTHGTGSGAAGSKSTRAKPSDAESRDSKSSSAKSGTKASEKPSKGANTVSVSTSAQKKAQAATIVAGGEAYRVLARKYRPQRFEGLIGQETMVRTLRNAFESGRIAQAYMLTGVRGVGKTTTARLLARALNYSVEGGPDRPVTEMPEPGEHCQAIMESRHVDVLEIDAASHTGVDNIREIVESARYKPVAARYKIYIIDEVHMLSKGAFNALLKTLEEPPEHVKFIFATTEVRKVPVTVLSRCQRFDLRRVDAELLVAHFKEIAKQEKVEIEDEALGLIAWAAEGSVRDGLSILDQAIALGSGQVAAGSVRSMLGLADRTRIFDLLETLFRGDAAASLSCLDGLHSDGAEPLQVLADLAEAVHTITKAKVAGSDVSAQTLSEAERKRAGALAEKLSIPLLSRAWQMLLKGLEEANSAPRPIAATEMILIRMAHLADMPTPEDVIRGLGPDRPDGSGGGRSTARPVAADGGPLGADPARSLSFETRGQSGDGPQAALQTEPAATPIQSVALRSFADVVSFIGDKRDIKLKIAMEECARLVRFKPGHLELRLTDGAPKGFANELGQKLSAWTGERWIVALANEEGEKTIAEQRREQHEAAVDEVKKHPLVQDIFEHFPDAEITSIRDRPDDDGAKEDQ
ncbi:DNA polymerase III subunit tau [bacterium MnTg02]|nr:DNA polymerase III subunit tau [bacterium MnTg02]